jgi:hypothetical protein
MPNADLNTFIGQMRQAGITLPKPVTAAITDQSKIKDAARTVTVNYRDLAEEWVNSVFAGTDPLDNPQLHRQASAYILTTQGLEKVATVIAEERVIAALAANADSILATMKKACDDAGATLTDVHNILGDLALNETEAVFRLGPTAVEAHARAVDASNLIRRVTTAWGALAALTGFARPSTETLDRLADLDLHTFTELRRHGDAWDIVRSGAAITLATDPATLKARADRRASDRAAGIQGRETAAHLAAQSFYGFQPA